MRIVKKIPKSAEFLEENSEMKVYRTQRCIYVIWKDTKTILRHTIKDYFAFTTDFIGILFCLLEERLGLNEANKKYIV